MSGRHDLTQELKRYTLDHLEVDLIGVAPAGRLSEAPEGHRPRDLLSGAASVIVTGVA